MNYTQKLSEITATVENEFGNLTEEKLNYKSNPDSWSIAQCIEHLIISNSKYFAAFEAVLSEKHKMTFWERNNPLTKYTGKQMIKTLGPVVIKKFQAPKLFLPSRSTIKTSIIKDFIEHQEKLCSLFKKLNTPQFEKIVITSPVAALLTLNLSDAMEIIVAHEERHLMQMQRIMNNG
ncbi:MAG: DinB family protein [Bacteroidota bacterium]